MHLELYNSGFLQVRQNWRKSGYLSDQRKSRKIQELGKSEEINRQASVERVLSTNIYKTSRNPLILTQQGETQLKWM